MIPVLVTLVAFLLLALDGGYCGGFGGVVVAVVVVGAVDNCGVMTAPHSSGNDGVVVVVGAVNECGVTTVPRSSGNDSVIVVVVLGGGGGWPTTPIPLGSSANSFESPIVDRG
jgi:hypothetical protein